MIEPSFRGTTLLNLDAKGRLAIPTRQRERLLAVGGATLVLTVDWDACLMMLPLPVWEQFERELDDLPAFDEVSRSVRRLYVGNADEVDMDAQGRILISQRKREFAGLNKGVALVGQGSKFEIWDEQRWNDRNTADLSDGNIRRLAMESAIGKIKCKASNG